MLLRGVVDQDVQAPECAYRAIDRALAEGVVSHVAGQQQAAPAGLLDRFAGLLRVVVFIEIHDRDVRPLLGEADRGGTPDAAVAAASPSSLPLPT